MSEVIENRVTSKLPRGLNERTFMSEPIENHAISKLTTAHINNHQCKHRRRFRRDREPSRIPIRSLRRLRNKSRKVRKVNKTMFLFYCRGRFRQSMKKIKYRSLGVKESWQMVALLHHS